MLGSGMLAATPVALQSLADLPTSVVYGIFIILGLLVGSFLNVVIHRIPVMLDQGEANYIAELRGEPLPHPEPYNLLTPRSACPQCHTAIAAWQNIPVISYLLLGGRCGHCKTAIPRRYPLIELCGGVFAALALWRFGVTWQALAACGLLWTLLALTVIDAQTQLLPDQLTLPLVWAGLLVNLLGWFVALPEAVIGAMAGYLSLWTVFWLFKIIRGKEGMGYGDFKLMAALGAWFGWQALPSLILLSSVVGALYGIAMLAVRRQERDTPFSFGPFIAGAGVVWLLFSREVAQLLPF